MSGYIASVVIDKIIVIMQPRKGSKRKTVVRFKDTEAEALALVQKNIDKYGALTVVTSRDIRKYYVSDFQASRYD